jgi:hypothetical protein
MRGAPQNLLKSRDIDGEGHISHLAALFGGAAILQQLFTNSTVPYALLAGGLKSLVPSDAKQFNQKMASWPDEHKSLVFGPNYTH